MSKLVALVCLAALVGIVCADQQLAVVQAANVNANSKIYQIRNEAQAMQDEQVDKSNAIVAIPLIKPKMKDANALEIEPKAAAAVDSSSTSDEKNSESSQNSVIAIVPLNKADSQSQSQSQSQSVEARDAAEAKDAFVVPVKPQSNSQSVEAQEAGDVKGTFVVPVKSNSQSQSQSAETQETGDVKGPFVVPVKPQSNSQSQSVEKSDVQGSFLVPINSQSDSQSAEPQAPQPQQQQQQQPAYVAPASDSKDSDSQSAEPSDNVQQQSFLIPFDDTSSNKPVAADAEVEEQEQQEQQLPMANDSVENDDDSDVDQQQQEQAGMMPSLFNIQSLGQFIHQVIENHRAFVRNELGLREGEEADDGGAKQHVVMMMMRPTSGDDEGQGQQQGPARGVMIIKMSKSNGLLGGSSDPDHGSALFAGNDESSTAAKPTSLYERARNFIMRAFTGNSDSSLQQQQQQQIDNWISANGERPMDDDDEEQMMMQPRQEEEQQEQQQQMPHKKCGGGLRLFGIHSPHVYRTVLHLLFFTGVLLFVMLVTLVVLRTIKPRRSSMRQMSISSIDGGSSDFADEIGGDKSSMAAKSRLFLSSDLLMSGERSLMYPQAPPAYDQVIVRDATCPSQLVPAKSAVRQVSGSSKSSSSLVHSLATAYKSRLSNLLGKDVIVETRSVVSLPPDYETDEEEKAKLNNSTKN